MAVIGGSLVVLTLSLISYVIGHGYLQDPPARNSIWREGFDNPVNYNDMGLNCGGFANQWENNNGLCGLCGDPYQGPRLHEVDEKGVYANGVIGRHYKMGSLIDVEAKITANHIGTIAFKICPVNDKNKRVTQECLDRYPLADVNGVKDISVFDQIGNGPGIVRAKLVLPKHLTCTQCVLQWYYTTGNNHGGPGTPQESFVNCADVKISVNGGPDPTPPPPTINRRTAHKTDKNGRPILDTLWDCNVISPYDKSDNVQQNYEWCMSNCIEAVPQQRNCPSDRCKCFVVEGMTTWPETTTRYISTTTSGDKRDPTEWTCDLVPPYDRGTQRKVKAMVKWCVENCVVPPPHLRNCPADTCNCYKNGRTTTVTPAPVTPPPGPIDPSKWKCEVGSSYKRSENANNIRRWCRANCLRPEGSRFCPESHCNCYYTGESGQLRVTTMRPQGSESSSLLNGRIPYLNSKGYCTLVDERDEFARNSQSIRLWCADTCIPEHRRARRCPRTKCNCSRF